MEAHTRTPRDLFEGKEHYEIPVFQRPYVWNEEFQWAPLWDDVVRVASTYVAAKQADPECVPVVHHFLGAVVYESKIKSAGDVTRHAVIDGQQRMTTLQLLLDAVHAVISSRGHVDMSESLAELILNGSARFEGKRERFKLWPSHGDRAAFQSAMDGTGGDAEHPVVHAHRFFHREALEWVSGEADDDGVVPPGTEELRVEALSSVLQDRLILVAIDLTGHDDSQLIFETLNDRGTPLLKADLIKNWVFRRGEQVGADVDQWAEKEWADFDTEWWRYEISQGRLTRSRVDIFLQYWLTMRRQVEVKTENAFRVFTEYAEPVMTDVPSAELLIRQLRRDADTYREMAQLDASTPEGRFYRNVIERLELAATTPVFLWLLSEHHRVPSEQRAIGLAALESWAIRRMILRQTTKDINKFVVAVLKALEASGPEQVGDNLRVFLSRQTAETRIWPSDNLMSEQLPDLRMYGSVRRDRLRVVLAAVEQHLREQSPMYEAVSLPDGLEIEHVMPQGWRTHWDPTILPPEAAATRDTLVNTIGNLTLVTKSLNGSLSNRPWTDVAAEGLTEGGSPNRGKRSLLEKFSLLALNKQIIGDHPSDWTEEDITDRAKLIVSAICDVWKGPLSDVQETALEAARSVPAHRELPELPWTVDDAKRLADEVAPSLLTLLDTLAEDTSRRWSNADFATSGRLPTAYSAVGALAMKARSFGRSNSPVNYAKESRGWTWSVSEQFAENWRLVRGATNV